MICRNHADTPARRQCFSCKAPICPACQQKAFHHIFCSHACIDEFAKTTSSATEVSEQLFRLDESLNEDIREYGEAIADSLGRKYSSLEENLDRALTSLAGLVEGVSNAQESDLANISDRLSKEMGGLDRREAERAEVYAGKQQAVERAVHAVRSVLLEVRDETHKARTSVDEYVRILLNRIVELKEKSAQQGAELSRDISDHTKDLSGRMADLGEALGKEVRGRTDEVGRRIEVEAQKVSRALEENRNGVVESNRQSKEHLSERIESIADRLCGALDDSAEALAEAVRNTKDKVGAELTEHRNASDRTLAEQSEKASKIIEDHQLALRAALAEIGEKTESGLKAQGTAVDGQGRNIEKLIEGALPEMFKASREHLASRLKESEEGFRSQGAAAIDRIDKALRRFDERQAELCVLYGKGLPEILAKQQAQTDETATQALTSIASRIEVQRNHLIETSTLIAKSLEEAGAKVRKEVSLELSGAVDTISALLVAHRGNWQDVIRSAHLGANRAASELRGEVLSQLQAEAACLAQRQSEVLQTAITDTNKLLKTRIQRVTSRWANRAAFGAMALAGLVLIAVPGTALFMHSIREESLEKALPSQDRSFVGFMERKLSQGGQDEVRRKAEPALVPLPAFNRGNTARRELAFTFDGGGANAKAASEILDVLREKKVYSTFFLTGDFIDRFPEITRRIVSDGHEGANHLLVHAALTDQRGRTVVTRNEFLRRLREVERLFYNVTGTRMAAFWRAPYGACNDELIRWGAEAGYRHVEWTRSGRLTLDTLDWVADPKDKLYRSSDQIIGKILDFERRDAHGLNGAIILMHLGSERKTDFPHLRLPGLIDRLGTDGYRPVRVSDILRTDVAELDPSG